MREFFNGWRRKVGCMTLLMACAVAAMWIRSHFYYDAVDIKFEKKRFNFASVYGATWLESTYHEVVNEPGEIPFESYLPRLATGIDLEYRHEWPFLARFDAWDELDDWQVLQQYRRYSIPYYCHILFLTSLSAYLILWKQRIRPKAAPDA